MASRLQDVILRGTAALRPVATTVAAGTLYFSTDTHVLERSTGSAWESYSAAAASGDVVGPGSALDQAIVVFDGATGKIVQDSGVLLTALATLPIAESDVTNLVTDLAAKAPLASPALTGTPTVPTASVGTNTTQAASTAFVLANAAAGSGDVVGPSSATNNALALFDGTTGKLLKDDPSVSRTVTGVWTFKGNAAGGAANLLLFTNQTDTPMGSIRVGDYGDSISLSLLGTVGNMIRAGNAPVLYDSGGVGLVCVNSTGGLYFSSGSNAIPAVTTPDAGLKRVAANVVRVSATSAFDATKGGGGISLGDLASVSAKPTAGATYRGTLWITWGTAGVADIVEVCAKDAADAYAWKPVASVASASTTFTGQFGPALYDAGNSGSSKTIDFNNGNDQYLTLTGNAAITFSNPVSGFRYALVINTGAGGFTPTFPGTVSWLDAVPTLPTTASKLYIVVLLYLGNVTKYLASFSKEP